MTRFSEHFEAERNFGVAIEVRRNQMSLSSRSGWWFGTFFIFPYIGLLIIPIDFHIFQRGGPTTNQSLSCKDG